ncbi:uncharacterized protein LOC141850388 [Brevipalpus obovatus]|uniref:uncharacterized protein LOC141850388 n=1 Tax=Brevipalpus obovatus TaxID=246614 RepID=UPI003D9EF6DB
MNSVESGIEACIRQIKKITHIKPAKSDLDIRKDVSELHKTIDRSNAVDWRKICQDLLDDIENIQDFCQIDSMLTLVSRLRKEISCRYFRSATSLPDSTELHDDLESISFAGKVDGNSVDDDESDEVTELVELLWSRIKDLATSQHLDLDNVMDKEIFFQRVKLLTSIDNLDEQNSIELYHLIRHQRMEKRVAGCDKFPALIEIIKSCIGNDLDLVENYHLFYGKLSYSQITSPYLILVKDKVEEYMRIYHDDRVEPQELLDILASLHDLSSYLAQCRLDLTSELSWTVQDSDESWDWRAYFVHLGIDNTLLRYLNQGLLQIMNDGLSSDHLNKIETDETCPPILIPCFCQVFQFLDCFQSVDLPGFQRSFSVIVNVSVIDFVLKVISRYSETNSISIKYLLMNSVVYSQNQLAKWDVKSCRMLELSNTLRSEIRSYHLNRLMFVLKDLSYAILYLQKLSAILRNQIPEEPENESHVFIAIVKDYIHHLSKADLNSEDALIFCSSIIPILMPFADNIDDLLHRNFREVHSGCLMILLRLALHESPIELVQMISKSGDSDVPEPYDHQSCWMNFIDNSSSSTAINNASIVASHTRKPPAKHLIRPFLESRCALPTKIFTNILANESDQKIASQLLLSIIRVAILNESQVNSVSQLLLPIIQSNDDWSWLDIGSLFKSQSQPFWLSSLHTLFDEYASEFLVRIFPPFIYQHMLILSASEKHHEISKLLKDHHHENIDEKVVFEEATKSLLSCITTIVSTLPLTLISSVEHLRNACPRRINTLFSCLTGQMVYSAMIRFLGGSQFRVDKRFIHVERFFSQMNQAMAKIVHNKRICDFLGRNLSSVIEVRLQAKTSYVISDESDQFSLIGELIDREHNMSKAKDCLFDFIKSDQLKSEKSSSKKPNMDQSEPPLNDKEMKNSPMCLLREYQRLKAINLHKIDIEQMKKLLNIANFRLSKFVIEGIIAERIMNTD